MIKITAKKTHQFLALLLICGFVISAFAHQASVSPNSISAEKEASQFLLPGETLASLCLNSSSGSHEHGDKRCDFCVLSHGMAAASEQNSIDGQLRHMLPEKLPIQQAVYQHRFRPCPPSQAPPLYS